MRKIALSILCCMLTMAAHAQYLNKPNNIWLKKMPDTEKKDRKDVVWEDRENENTVFLEVTNPTLESFIPISGTSNGKAVIVCPGGAYARLAYQKEGQEIAQWLARQGYNAYVLAYRVPNNRSGALQDIQRAIRAVRSIGAQEVGVIGFSAGASLACRAATNWENPTYETLDEKIDTLSCRPDFAILIYPAYLDEGQDGTLSPDLHVTAQTPPMFVFGTEDDVRYSGPSCKTIMKAMQEANAPIEMHYLTKGGHGYGMRTGVGLLWPQLAETWLKSLTEK